MKKNLLKFMVLMLAFFASTGQMWGQMFKPVGQPNAQTMQSQQVMQTGGAYNGTVYEPFSAATPSEANSPAQVGRRRGYDKDGNWTPDAPDMEYAGDTQQSDQSPIGEPWVMVLFALLFAGLIAIRQYKRKSLKSMNMKNSTKFIVSLALLLILGVGNAWSDERTFDGTEYIYWKVSPADATWWSENNADHYIQLKFNDGDWKWTNWQKANNVNSGWARWLVPAGSYWDIMLKTTNGNKTTGSSAIDGNTSHNIIYNYGENYTIFSWSQSYFAHGAYVYFDNSTAAWDDSYKTIIIGRDRYSYIYQLTNFANTNIWYYNSALTFYDFTEFAFIGTSSLWGDEENKDNQNPEARKGYANHKTVGIPRLMDHSSRLYNLFITEGATDGVHSLTHNAYSSYTSLNSTQKVYSVARVPGGSYSATNAKAEVAMISYALTGATTCTQQNETLSTSESSQEISACRTASTSFTVSTATGYNFDGWYPAANSGSQLEDDATYTYRPTSATDVYARWTAKQSTITFSQSGAGYASGTPASNTATYGVAMTAITPPTAATGYKFQGYFDGENGTGTKYYNADGTSAKNWDKDTEEGTTLYAYFEKAQLTDFTFSPTTAGGGTTITITPTISPSPTGTTYICWGFYSDSDCTREVDGVAFSADPSSGSNDVTFTTPSASGVYYVKAVYRTGSDCSAADNAADVLNTRVKSFIVASDHTVTVRHMCGDVEIHEPTEVTVPASETASVSPLSGDDVFGYEFSSWTLGDGVSSEDDSANPIDISAYFNGTLTANYTKKGIIYFKNTLGWDTVYLNMYSAAHWNTKGSGNKGANVTLRNHGMYRVHGTSDIFYFDYGAESITPSEYVSFTDRTQDDYEYFSDAGTNPVKVCYPTKPDASGSENTDCGFTTSLPMFVPASGQTTQGWNNNNDGQGDHANYFNKGYWRLYEPATGRTGYKIKIYNQRIHNASRKLVYELDMTESTTEHGFVEVTIDLEGNYVYGIKVLRDDNRLLTYKEDASDMKQYENSEYTPLIKDTGTDGDPSNWAAASMQTTTAGDYTFKLACDNGNGTFKIGVKKPAASGDYRVVYRDANHNTDRKQRFSRTITKKAGADDIVSFFIDKDNSESMKFQYISNISGSTVTWTDVTDGAINLSSFSDVITKDGVYNFYLHQDASGNISVTKVEPYTGNFYIRTDLVGGTKWADYQNAAHMMAYSQYSEENNYFSHYWMAYSTGAYNDNVKFVVANDYSPWISDTVIQQTPEVAHINEYGTNSQDVNIRFSYDRNTNVAKRTYLAASYAGTFLVLKNNAESGNFKDASGTDKAGVDITFSDRENYIYDITAQVNPSANVKVKVYAHYNTTDQEFIGHLAEGDWSSANCQQLLSGSGSTLQTIRIIYDFKTNRIVTAWEAAGTTTGELKIDADLMIVREHQEAAENILLAYDDENEKEGKITTDKHIYGVMRFNRWILNNLSNPEDKEPSHAKADPDDAGYWGNHHTALSAANQLPTYQRNLYYISFPFDVNVSDIFGFGNYGTHFAIQRYDGKGRASNGYWIDSDPNWKWVPPTGKLNAYEGYVLSLSLSNMAVDKTTVWANNCSEVELYFPSAQAGFTINTYDDVVIPKLADADYKCTIERDSRTLKDSYWRCIGVPCYANYSDNLKDSVGNTINWQTADETLPFIYDINWQDKSLTAYAGANFPFKAMHSYLVQYKGEIHWSNVVSSSATAGIVARKRNENTSEHTYCLKLMQGDNFCDQTFVRLTDKEDVTNGFDFDEDLWKQEFSTRANIYTRIGNVNVAGNSMPFSDQTTIVPVGVKIAADGDYTFAMPEGTDGVGVVLIDNITGTRTNLGLTDYSVTLTAGAHDERFSLEISPISQVHTDIEQTGAAQQDAVRKVMIDGVLYIVKDGQVFDARGNRIQ